MSEDDFAPHRGLVMALAYDITSSWSDAEDIAQEAWLRWSHAVAGGRQVRDPRAYLARIATNLALDTLRRREYPGQFLPEPIPADAADAGLLAEGEVSLALSMVLETLSPLERAAFVLHDVFAFGYDEVAAILGREQAAVRQLVTRARGHVRSRRPRYDVDPGEHRELLSAFLAAALAGDLDTLVSLLADDVTLLSDGGGKASVARRPITGSSAVARFLAGIAAKGGDTGRVEFTLTNRAPAWIATDAGRVDQVGWVLVHQGRIREILIVRNPDKLGAVQRDLDRAR